MTDRPGIGIDWAKASGDIWAQRWRDTDRGLEPLHPHLVAAIAERAPARSFRAFDIGCGPGSTSIAVADACPEAAIIACDISPALAEVARERTADIPRVRVVVGDAEAAASSEGPFDLIFSRHGVMFFSDPVRAFGSLRAAASRGATLVFSCFQGWKLNPWASELASAVAGEQVRPPGREPGGFAFADPEYVLHILNSSGWGAGAAEPISFRYIAAEGGSAIEDALSFMTDIGPASRILQSLPDEAKGDAVQRMRGVIERHVDDDAVVFPAAAWVWQAAAT